MYPNRALNLIRNGWILDQKLLGILTSLAQEAVIIAEKRPAFLDDVQIRAQIKDFAGLADAGFVEHNVKFCLAERRRNFVFSHTDTGAVADSIAALFDALHPAYIEPDDWDIFWADLEKAPV